MPPSVPSISWFEAPLIGPYGWQLGGSKKLGTESGSNINRRDHITSIGYKVSTSFSNIEDLTTLPVIRVMLRIFCSNVLLNVVWPRFALLIVIVPFLVMLSHLKRIWWGKLPKSSSSKYFFLILLYIKHGDKKTKVQFRSLRFRWPWATHIKTYLLTFGFFLLQGWSWNSH